MDYFKLLPSDITLDILSRLPTETILDSKLVCKKWNSLVSGHRSFHQMYLDHLLHPSDSTAAVDSSGKLSFLGFTRSMRTFHYIEYNQSTAKPTHKTRKVNFTVPCARFVGSINGLICLAENQFVCIANPITRECVLLPEFKEGCDINFGYVASTNEYKVVGVCGNVEIHIYTLGSGKGWRSLGNFKSRFKSLFLSYRGVFANGTIYWLDRGLKRIITFDLAEEKFCENIPGPPLLQDSGWSDTRIGILHGCVYIAVGGRRGLVDVGLLNGDEGECIDIWVLRKEGVQHEMIERKGHQSLVWSKDFRVGNRELLAVTKTGGVLTHHSCYLNFYDTKSLTPKRLVKFKGWCRVIPHKNTLISLKELGEDSKVMGSIIEFEKTKSHEQPSSKQTSQHVQPKTFNFKKAFGF